MAETVAYVREDEEDKRCWVVVEVILASRGTRRIVRGAILRFRDMILVILFVGLGSGFVEVPLMIQ